MNKNDFKLYKVNIVSLLSMNAYIDFIKDITPEYDTTVLENIRNSIENQINTEYKLRQKIKTLEAKIKRLKKHA